MINDPVYLGVFKLKFGPELLYLYFYYTVPSSVFVYLIVEV